MPPPRGVEAGLIAPGAKSVLAWVLVRLAAYSAVAAGSGALFLGGAAIYAAVVPPPPPPEPPYKVQSREPQVPRDEEAPEKQIEGYLVSHLWKEPQAAPFRAVAPAVASGGEAVRRATDLRFAPRSS